MTIPLNAQDVVLAAAAAFFLTGLINAVFKIYKSVVNRSTEIRYSPRNRDSVLEKCCALFPTEHLRFNNALYKRGMRVRVVTARNVLLEGQFIGVNDENVICIMTPFQVVAQELDMVEEIEAM